MASSQPAKGCFKCGGTGHWARDCPADPRPNEKPGDENAKEGQRDWKEWKAPVGKKKQAFDILGPKRIFTRPKLTEELLLSKDKGLGFILQEFPKLMVIKGKGHEVGDLRRLLELYQRWHKMMFPSVAYGDFVEKVEKLGAKKRVRMTIRDLRQKIMHGEGDPYEPADEEPIAWGTSWEKQTEEASKAAEHVAWETGPEAEPEWGPAAPSGGLEGVAYAGMGKNAEYDAKLVRLALVGALTTDVNNHCEECITEKPTAAPAPASGGLTAEQRARIEANKARALALQRERAAKAAEDRAGAGGGAPDNVEAPRHEEPTMPVPNAPGPKSMRRRLADDTDEDDDNNPKGVGNGRRAAEDVRDECVRNREADGVRKQTAEERAVQAQKKRARKEVLDSLARKRGGEREESEEEEERGQRRRPTRRNDRDTLGDSDPENETRVEVEEEVAGTQQGKRRRLLKTDVVAEEEDAPVGLEDELLEDVEVRKGQVAAKGRRQVLMDSDDED